MFKRIIIEDFLRLARSYPVVTLTGPRQSGKTTLCKYAFPDYQYVNLEDLESRQIAIHDPKAFLALYPNKVIIDEIQRAPDLPSLIQITVDKTNKSGQFILTGSQQFEVTNNINQSLAGRTALLRLLPLAFTELPKKLRDRPLSEILYTGFYPRIHEKNLNPSEALSFYLNTYVERDLRQLINLRELQEFDRFLKLCASLVGQLINYTQLANDTGVSQKTIKSWLSLLSSSYIIYLVHPHSSNFKKRLTKAPKLYFYDVGLAAYLLSIHHAEHIQNHPLRGPLFENFIISEILKNAYNHASTSNLYIFRDSTGNEVDLILDYGIHIVAIEIKSSMSFNKSMLKGLSYYKNLNSRAKTILIYGGNQSFEFEGTHVFSYRDLSKLFALLGRLG